MAWQENHNEHQGQDNLATLREVISSSLLPHPLSQVLISRSPRATIDLLKLLHHDLVKVLQRFEDSGCLVSQKDRVSQLYPSRGRSLP